MDYLANSLPGSRSISLYDSERTYTDPGMYSSKAIEDLSSLMILANVCEAEQQDGNFKNSYQQVDGNEFNDVAATSKRWKQLLDEYNKRWSTGDHCGYNNVHDQFSSNSSNYNNEQHPHHHPVLNVYRCCDCDRTFSSFQALGGHRSGRCKEVVEYNMDPAEPRQDEVHRCHVCNKTFTSYQALGGHVSSHSKNKNNNNIHQDQFNSADITTCTAESKNARQKIYSTVTHPCKVCSKTFPTGQALGGHQRLHYKGRTEAPAIPSQQTSARKHLGFDLNVIPSMEDEDGIYEPSVILQLY